MKQLFKIIIIILFSATAVLASNFFTFNKVEQTSIVAKASKKSHKHELFYAGKIEPVVISTISSPIEGKVKSVMHKYGDLVKKGDILFELQSNGNEDKTGDIIVDYLKNRDELYLSDTKLKNEKKLLDAGIIAKNEYTDVRRQRDLVFINYIKSKAKIEDLLNIIGINIDAINKISLDDLPAVTNLINMHHNIPVRAENDGVYLQGSLKDGVSILPGVDLKKGSAIGVIANTNEIKINISVPETDINRVHVGQNVKITGSGFKDIILEGEIYSLNLFNFDGDVSSGEVSYPVIIKVPNITTEIRDVVHVGMSAKVSIVEQITNKLYVPLNSINKVNKKTYVTRVDKYGKKTKAEINVGRTTLDDIEVVSGLRDGEQVSLVD